MIDNKDDSYLEFKYRMDMIFDKYSKKNAVVKITSHKCEGIHYQSIKKAVLKLGALMETSDLKRADRIGVVAPHMANSVITILALAYLGYTVVPIDCTLPEQEWKKLLDTGDVQAVFATNDFLNQLMETRVTLIEIPEQNCTYRIFRRTNRKYEAIVPTDASVMAIIFSSGTSGYMKGVEVTWKSILKACDYMIVYTNLSQSISFFNVLPFSHIAGYSSVMSCFLVGAETGYVPQVNAEWLSVGFQVYRPTNFIMIPKVYDVIRQKIITEVEKKKLVKLYFKVSFKLSAFCRSHFGIKLRFLFIPVLRASLGPNIQIGGCGTAPCPSELAEFYLNMGIDFVNVYGSTETGFPITASNCKMDRYDINSVGSAEQFADIKIIIAEPDADGCGEIRVKSPLLMKGYFRDQKLTELSFDQRGYFKTGDLGYIDHEKHLHVIGRIKEVILLHNGQKVSPEDVDTFYKAVCPGITLASCGVPTSDNYDEIHIFLEKGKNTVSYLNTCKRQIQKHSAQNSSRYKVKEIHIIDKIPITSVGKIKRNFLREQIGIPELGMIEEVVEYQGILDTVIEIIRHLDGSHRVISDADFLTEDIGLDSLQLIELCARIENQYGINVAALLTKETTVENLVTYITETDKGKKLYSKNIDCYPQKKNISDRLLITFFAGMSRILWKYKAENAQIVQIGKKYILCPNHESYLDSMWVISALCKKKENIERFCCMASDHLTKKRILKKGFHALGGIPVDRTGNPIPATERALSYLQNNDCLMLIHPEGTRTRNGELGEFKLGAAQLSIKADVEIIPVCLKGPWIIFPPGKSCPKIFALHTFRRQEIKVIFGTPISPLGKTPQEITTEIKTQILQMKEKEM